MKYRIAIIVFLLFGFRINAQTYWQQEVNYQIQVSLNANDKTLKGFEKLTYVNNSPDTLRFIWFHLWPNAYKNDKTAYCNQSLENGTTKFYFSKEEERGYINQLNFSVNGENATTEPHEKHIDIVKVLLPSPLPPKQSVVISTPFFVKLPYIFSRAGFEGNNVYATQWYPKPAVYDSKGWHEMPYLDQGEFYSEFGKFEVEIIVPENYIVAASGELQNKEQLEKLKTIGKQKVEEQAVYKAFFQKQKQLIQEAKQQLAKNKTQKKVIIKPEENKITPSTKTTSYLYQISNAHDFAWFASPEFIVQYDTVQLQTKIVDVFAFFRPKHLSTWKFANTYTKDGLKHYSNWIGEYAYNTATTVCGIANDFSGGMEYPSITLITTQGGGKELDETIVHEIGHNWFYGVLASNEREHAWMDEGMNTYYQKRYMDEKYKNSSELEKTGKAFIDNRIPDDMEKLVIKSLKGIQKYQAIDLPAEKYGYINYAISVYMAGAIWMSDLEKQLGTTTFDSCMKRYYNNWQFKHPYPEDFKKVVEQTSSTNIDIAYQKLYSTTAEPSTKKKTKVLGFFSLKDTDTKNNIGMMPFVAYNLYDGLKLGLALHNYQLPLPKFQFYLAPQYATLSKSFAYNARFSYNQYKPNSWLEISSGIQKFTMNDYKPENGDKIYQSVERYSPSIKYTVYNKDARNKSRWIFQAKSFILKEDNLSFNFDGLVEKVSTQKADNIINQISITNSNNRVLYPYEFNFKVEQGQQFVRLGVTGNYFFNYAKQKGGLQARVFAGKFIYTTDKTFVTQYNTYRYHLNLGGTTGAEDYTYSNYFMGRNEFEGWTSQQIMQKDGFMKIRATQMSNEVGRSDNWVMAFNVSGDIPNEVNIFNALPIKLPVQFFADLGTYAEAWKENAANGRFVYDFGLKLPVAKGIVNVYFPLMYSKVYRDFLKSTVEKKKLFWRTVTFSIDIQKLQLNKLNREIPL